jgi:uncharacterized protein YmfQ (DUF2313 family)
MLKRKRNILQVGIFSALLLAAPSLATSAERAADKTDRSKYSDRDRKDAWETGKKQLEQGLKSGQDKNFYRKQLEKLGFQITSINYDKPDYVEYEVVKGDQTYEVQIDFDKNASKATKVDVDTNVYKAGATKQALQGRKVKVSDSKNNTRFSDRDRRDAGRNTEKELEQVLKTGEDKDFYRKQLEKMGWKVTSVNYDKPDYVEYEIVKGNDTYEVQIDFDKNSRKATKIDVTTNMWTADATSKALEAQDKTRASGQQSKRSD